MSKLIVIIGITGNQGASVADVFLKESGWKIRGISRNPDKAKNWTEKGVEIVKGDLNDIDSLISAFKGATAIFGNTDFWQLFNDPENKKKLKPGQTINEIAFDNEVAQGKNIAKAAATVEGLERFVLSALSNSKYWSKGKYTWVYHFDSKATVVEYIRKELPELAAKMSILQMGMYMSNWAMGIPAFAKASQQFKEISNHVPQEDGTFRLSCAGAGNAIIPLVDPRKDCGYFVRALVQSPPGKNLLGAGSFATWEEYLKLWCGIFGQKYGGYDQVPLETMEQTMEQVMPGGLGREIGEMFEYAAEFGYDGGDPSVIHPKDVS
ncbi:MAG: hypothetical protein Q9187_009164 [Circinaria calcarea]